MSKVYITQDVGKINFLPAEKYGRLIPVINGHVNHTQLNNTMDGMFDKMKNITKNDWIVPAGHPAIIALAGFIMADLTGHIRILAWDNQTEQYVPCEIEVDYD